LIVQIWTLGDQLVASQTMDMFDLKNNEPTIFENHFEKLGSVTFEVTLKEDLEKKSLMAKNVVYNKLKCSLFKKNKNNEIMDTLAKNLSGNF
jgi:hypothetical protein